MINIDYTQVKPRYLSAKAPQALAGPWGAVWRQLEPGIFAIDISNKYGTCFQSKEKFSFEGANVIPASALDFAHAVSHGLKVGLSPVGSDQFQEVRPLTGSRAELVAFPKITLDKRFTDGERLGLAIIAHRRQDPTLTPDQALEKAIESLVQLHKDVDDKIKRAFCPDI